MKNLYYHTLCSNPLYLLAIANFWELMVVITFLELKNVMSYGREHLSLQNVFYAFRSS